MESIFIYILFRIRRKAESLELLTKSLARDRQSFEELKKFLEIGSSLRIIIESDASILSDIFYQQDYDKLAKNIWNFIYWSSEMQNAIFRYFLNFLIEI